MDWNVSLGVKRELNEIMVVPTFTYEKKNFDMWTDEKRKLDVTEIRFLLGM